MRPLKKKNEAGGIHSFYSQPEFAAWQQVQEGQGGFRGDDWEIKYYKGLGTNTSAEGKQYFADLQKHRKDFTWSMGTRESIDLAFNRARTEDRKDWIQNKYDPAAFIDPKQETMSYEEFIDTEVVQFAHADNVRSIPSAIDGLKPVQRKVLYASFKRALSQDIKVVQLGGYIAEQTAYHHGERALHKTIVGMAQRFVGSNNLNLLEPSGQFGTRADGGKDFASPRYIYTRLSPLARLMFRPEDEPLLKYLEEDGMQVEPRTFLPVVPLLLVNGAQGIGTGWSSFVPSVSLSIYINVF